MNNSDKISFTNIMYGLADNFSASITPEGMKFRFECLQEYSLDQIRKAAIYLVKTRKFTKMPTIAEFIEAIDGSGDDKAEAEAMKVIAEIKRIGSYQSPQFEDPKTRQVVASMGWGNICSTEESKLRFFVKDFIEAYKSENRRQETRLISGHEEDSQDVRRLLSGITKAVA